MKKVYESCKGKVDVENRAKYTIYDYSNESWLIDCTSAYLGESKKVYISKNLLKENNFNNWSYIKDLIDYLERTKNDIN